MFKSRKFFLKGSIAVFLALLLLIVPIVAVFAASPGTQGQPNQSCQAQPSSPGNAANTTGAFNPNGIAATSYAGATDHNTINSHTVAQYDVACFQVSTKP